MRASSTPDDKKPKNERVFQPFSAPKDRPLQAKDMQAAQELLRHFGDSAQAILDNPHPPKKKKENPEKKRNMTVLRLLFEASENQNKRGKIGILIRNNKTQKIRRVVDVNFNEAGEVTTVTFRIITPGSDKKKIVTENADNLQMQFFQMIDQYDFVRGGQLEGEHKFEYDKTYSQAGEVIESAELSVGDKIGAMTSSGSKYVFLITGIDEKGLTTKVKKGSKVLKQDFIITNNQLQIGSPITFPPNKKGKKQQTSSISALKIQAQGNQTKKTT